MATTPPTYSFPSVYYNPVFFPSISGYLTLAQANSLFLARTGIASSVAITTSFTGSVVISGLLTLSGGLSLTGGLTVDNLTVNTLSTLNTNTIINNILTINATSSVIGQMTFSLIPNLPTGYQFLTTGIQTITGIKNFSSPIVTSGASITSNTILSSSLVNNSITQTQIASPYSLLNSGSIQTILGDKILNGTNTTNDMILNIFSAFSGWNGTIGFIPACTTNYLNLTTTVFDSMLYIGQSIGSGPNQPYGFCICDYNSGVTGIRISGTGISGNCNISCNGTFGTSQLYTAQNGIYINGGDFTSPNNSYINVVSCNAIQAITGTNVVVSATSFQIIPLSVGTLPTALTNIAGLITNWGCAGQGETDFINQSRLNAGGFNFYSSPQTSLPALLMQITPTGTYIPSSLEVHKISSNNQQLEIFLANTQAVAPVLTGDSGLKLGWNISGGGGEVDFTALGQGGTGGFAYYASNASTLPYLLASLYPYLFNVTPPITSAGLITADHFLCTNSGASSGFYNMTASTISTANIGVGGSATFSGTSTFNVNHPTTILGNNISTNTTQYATVGYCNSINIGTILPTNNINIGSGNYTALSGGSNNSVMGIGSAIALTSGVGNIVIGSASGNLITNGSNNVVLGSNTWQSGGNWSNCCVFGQYAYATANHQVVLGTGLDSVITPGYACDSISTLYTTNAFPAQTYRTILYSPAAGFTNITVPNITSDMTGAYFTVRRVGLGSGTVSITMATISNSVVWQPLLVYTPSVLFTIPNLTTSPSSYNFVCDGVHWLQI